MVNAITLKPLLFHNNQKNLMEYDSYKLLHIYICIYKCVYMHIYYAYIHTYILYIWATVNKI